MYRIYIDKYHKLKANCGNDGWKGRECRDQLNNYMRVVHYKYE